MKNFILISSNQMLINQVNLLSQNLDFINYTKCFYDEKNAYIWIKNCAVNYILLDLFLFDADALNFAEKIASEFPEINMILVSDFLSKELSSCARKIGINNIISTNLSTDVLKGVFNEEINILPSQKNKNLNGSLSNCQIKLLDEKITNICLSVGISPRNLGYAYFKEAIKLTTFNPNLMSKITKELYPMIAERFNTTSTRVERALRHALDVASYTDDFLKLNDILGCDFTLSNKRLTSSEFIAIVADKMALENW